MKKLFSFILGLLFLFCSSAVQADEIAEAPSSFPMLEEAIKYLKGEEMY